jgi:hypothetical protein
MTNGGASEANNNGDRLANKSVQEVLGALNSSPPKTTAHTSSQLIDNRSEDIQRQGTYQVPQNEVINLVCDEVSTKASAAKKQNVVVTRAAFKKLCKNLQWHETKGKGFKYVNYQNFIKKYPNEHRVLSNLGMTFAQLGVFIHDYLEADTPAEEFGIRETLPKYYSEWLVVLKQFDEGAHEKDADEPTLEELESEDEVFEEDLEEEDQSGEDTDDELLLVPGPQTAKVRGQVNANIQLIKNDFLAYGHSKPSKDLCSTLIQTSPAVGRKKKSVGIAEVNEQKGMYSSKRITAIPPSQPDSSELLMTSLIEAMQMNTNLDGVIEPLKNSIRDPAEWFSHYDMIAGARNWSTEVKVRMLRLKLKGTAARIFKSLSEEEQCSYRIVKEKICEELRPRDSKTTASVDYFGAKQKVDEGVADFEYRLNKMRKRADLEISNDRKVEIFISGLTPQLRLSCAQYKHLQYAEVVRLAKEHEQILPTPEEAEVNAIANFSNYKPQQPESGTLRCHYCKEAGHIKTVCKKWQEIVAAWKCHRCQKTGHLVARCPEPAKKNE